MSLCLWLPLIKNTDNQGLSDVTITNNGATIIPQGKIGSCYSFDGNDDYISIDCPDLYRTFSGESQPFSIAFWIYHADSTRGVIFGDFGLSGSIGFNIELTANHQIRYYWNGNPDKIFANTALEINVWTHIVLTYDGNKICMYKNGLLQTDTYANSLNKLTKTSGLFYLGRDYRTGATALNGRINDFRIYDTALSPREIKEVSKALLLHYPLSREGFGADNIIPNTWPEERTFEYPASSYRSQFSPITTIIPTASKYTLSFWAKSTVAGDRIRTYFYSPNTTTTCVSNQGITKTASDGSMDFTLSTEWEHYWVTYSQNETTAVKHVICPRMGAVGNTDGISSGTGTVSIKCIKLEEGDTPTPWTPNSTDNLYSAMGLDSNVAYDVSGYGNNATKVGTITASADTPRYSTSSSFDGSSYIINNTSTIHLSNEFTIAWWGKVNSWQKKWEGMFLLQNTPSLQSGNGVVRILSCLHGSVEGVMDLAIGQPGANAEFDYYNWSYIIGEWTHYACTYKAGVVRMYKDGTQTYTATISDNSSNDYYFTIGRRNKNCDCQMSDFRIYNTALSADEIADLYHTPISLSNSGTLLTQGELSEV